MRLQLRIAIFFAANPDIELTQEEMVRKFGLTGSNAKDLLAPCVQQGVLSIETINRGRHIYRAGPQLKEEI
jgi:DNA-binding transcriptional regulator LsrR (DeoR family)